MHVEAHGFSVELPRPWEGAVRTGEVGDGVRQRAAFQGLEVQTPPVLHMASVPLPVDRGDFGSGAVDIMGEGDAFIAVVEYGPESVGTALFDTGPLPRHLDHRLFQPDGLQRAIAGQSGYQRFCTENGRALCLYVVLGAHHAARTLTREVNDILTRVRIVVR